MQASGWGGHRPGAGRKFRYGERTRAVRVPVSRVAEVQAYLESGTHSDELEPMRDLAARWREKVAGRESSPRWQKAAELLRELEGALS
jgi:hypothetical protein